MKNRPMLIAGSGFAIGVISFLIAAQFGKGTVPTYLFYTGFIVCTIGVLDGFFIYRQDK